VTNRGLPSLDKYLQDIGREELISPQEEVDLARKIRNGDQIALQRLVRANLRFVVSVSKQYQNQGLSLPDLINEGNIGLIKAAERFDETKGFKFISYAVWWIRQSILQALSEQARMVRLPLNKIGALNKISRTMARMEQELGRSPSEIELAEEMKIDCKEIKSMLSHIGRPISMDAPLTNEDNSNLYDILLNEQSDNPEDKLIKESLCKEIERSFNQLNSREAETLKLFFGLNNKIPLSLDEIADHFDLTRERVRQIKEKALRKIRNSSKNKLLRSYLG
ncbi:MAG: RNA polymerase sigma factor RpoD/SigA, partial [Bacteroidales bacterium]|nr:RNA polymerase sigma factor RpoD/SigA [Bacteroidales bacterium]